jgi:hypothetical protein
VGSARGLSYALYGRRPCPLRIALLRTLGTTRAEYPQTFGTILGSCAVCHMSAWPMDLACGTRRIRCEVSLVVGCEFRIVQLSQTLQSQWPYKLKHACAQWSRH